MPIYTDPAIGFFQPEESIEGAMLISGVWKRNEIAV